MYNKSLIEICNGISRKNEIKYKREDTENKLKFNTLYLKILLNS